MDDSLRLGNGKHTFLHKSIFQTNKAYVSVGMSGDTIDKLGM